MLYESESGTIRIALGGDLILTRRLSVFREERFLKLSEILVVWAIFLIISLTSSLIHTINSKK